MLDFKPLDTVYVVTHTVNMGRLAIMNARFLAVDMLLKNAVLTGEMLCTVLVTWVGNFLYKLKEVGSSRRYQNFTVFSIADSLQF